MNHCCLMPLFLLLLLGGCGALRHEPAVAPEPPGPLTFGAEAAAEPGGLYRVSRAISLFDDRRAWRPGDVLTIRLEERTRSSHASETTINKKTDNSLSKPTLLGEVINSPFNTSVENQADFSGEAASDQSNSLSGTVTVVVTDVLPNGLMRVKGEKRVRINRGNEIIAVSGLVRPEDVDGDNSVSSLRLANAELAYTGTGPLANANRVGWFTRFFISPLSPF